MYVQYAYVCAVCICMCSMTPSRSEASLPNTDTHKHTCTHKHKHMSVCTFSLPYTHTNTCRSAHIRLHTYIHTCIHTSSTHTHTHTNTGRPAHVCVRRLLTVRRLPQNRRIPPRQTRVLLLHRRGRLEHTRRGVHHRDVGRHSPHDALYGRLQDRAYSPRAQAAAEELSHRQDAHRDGF